MVWVITRASSRTCDSGTKSSASTEAPPHAVHHRWHPSSAWPPGIKRSLSIVGFELHTTDVTMRVLQRQHAWMLGINQCWQHVGAAFDPDLVGDRSPMVARTSATACSGSSPGRRRRSIRKRATSGNVCGARGVKTIWYTSACRPPRSGCDPASGTCLSRVSTS